MVTSLRNVLLTIAGVLGLFAIAAWLTAGFQVEAGPIRFSAREPSRILLQASVAWLIVELIAPAPRHRVRWIVLAMVAFLAAAVGDSSPRRVGDGAEYVAMTMSMSRGGPPALLPEQRDALSREIEAMPGFDATQLEEPLIGRDGRQDFYHFWLYSLLATPAALMTRILGVHVNYAFTALNLSLLLMLVWWLVRSGPPEVAALIVAGPLLWWVDKAHTEVFMFVMLAFAVLLIDSWPAAALAAAGLAAAQNPAAGVVLAACIVSAVLRRRGEAVRPAMIVAVLAVAAAAPLYYRWHLGVWSPLSDTIGRHLPGLRAALTPVLDPNLGLVPYAPVMMALACLGAWRQSRRLLWLVAVAAIALLVVFAQSGNVNHGGSPGVSRYALWLLALATPFVAAGHHSLKARPVLLRAAAVASVLFSTYAFRPAWPDRVGDSPNWLASALWTRWPGLDNPLPEVFAERTYGSGGSAPVPVATSRCEKILILGDGRTSWWPVPCQPRRAPAMCEVPGALCYANGSAFVMAPAQPTFTFDESLQHAWTWADTARLDVVLKTLGQDQRFVRLADRGGRIENVLDLQYLYIVEGTDGAAAWVQSTPSGAGSVHVRVEVPSMVEVLDGITLANAGPGRMLVPGLHEVPLPSDRRLLLVVTDARQPTS